MNACNLLKQVFLKAKTFNLSIDRKKIITVFIASTLFFNATAQLVVDTFTTPSQLANLLTGPGVAISNVVYTGSSLARGKFSATGTNLGINDGIILSSGQVTSAVGPNNVPNMSTDFYMPGDPYLNILSLAITHDAAILEFDFIPQDDTISFRYVFASEEYPEFVCTSFNDAFAFTVSGPGIVGNMNLAVIPGTTIPVTINTINPGLSSGGSTTCLTNFSAYYVSNLASTTIEYDGFTTVLTAMAVILPCQIYHLRITIADASDGVYDSAVFLEKGSLSSSPIVDAGVDQTFCTSALVNLGIPAVAGWTYSWSPAIGLSNSSISNPILNLTNTGNTPIVQTYVATASSGSCTLADTVSITIIPTQFASFNVPNSLCIGQPAILNYTGTTSINTLLNWNTNGASFSGSYPGPYSISYAAPGDYNVSLSISQAGCVSPVVQNVIHVYPNPLAAITTPTTSCEGDTITVTSSGSIASSFASYNWNFGLATLISGNNQGPYQFIAPSGSVNFSLSITDSTCVSNSASSLFIGKPLPIANIIAPSNACLGSTDNIYFVGSNLTPSSYSWNFSDVQVLNGGGSGPFILNWNSTGDHIISVEVTDDGCISKDSDLIHVDFQPTSSFSNLPFACMYDYVGFNFTGISNDSTTFNWSFDSGSISNSTGSDPQYLYWDHSNTFSVALITSNGTCSDTAITTIIINKKPIADYSTLSVCLNDTARIINNSYLPDSSGNIFEWTFGDMTTSNDFAPSHLFSTYGNYYTQLVITAANGCKDSITRIAEVNPLPKTYLATDTVCFGVPNHFANKISIAQGLIASQNWNWGDASTSTGNQKEHSYAQAGNYSVQLLVNSDKGCKDSAVNIAKVIGTPQAIFNPDSTSGCVPLKVQLFDHSNSVEGSIVDWQWNFGDGFLSSDSSANHLYTSPGTYSLSLHVTNSRGCIDDTTLYKYITVYPTPKSDFSFSSEPPSIVLSKVNFYDQSSPVSTWLWNFGDNSFSSLENPDHLYDSAGVYFTSLIVMNQFGCKDTSFREIVLIGSYTLWIPNAFTPNGDGKNDVFEVKGENLNSFKMDIYNRWGILVFTSNNIFNGWNGEVDNRKVQTDSYIYRIATTDTSSKDHLYVGQLSLIF